MIQFFRKYTKQLLAVFMALLLVVWLGGSALESWLEVDRTGFRVASTSHGEITGEDQAVAQSQTKILESLGRPWKLAQSMDLLDWIVVSRESERLGSPVPASKVSYQLTSGPIAQQAHQVARAMDIKLERVANAMSRQEQINTMYSLFYFAMQPSEAEIRQAAKKALEKVRLSMVIFPLDAFKDNPEVAEASFSDAEIQAQFDEFKDTRSGQGLNFGYLLEPRVKAQYIKVDAQEVLQKLQYPEKLLRKRAWSFWKENKNDQAFRRPPEPPKEEGADEAVEEGESTEPEKSKSPLFENFAEAEAAAIERVKLNIAKDEARKMADQIANVLWQPWEIAGEVSSGDESGPEEVASGPTYLKAPESVMSESYLDDELARIRGELRYPEAVSVGTTDWFTQQDARNVEGIGLASTPRTSGPTVAFTQAAFLVEGIEEYPTDPETPNRNFYAARYQPGASPMEDRSGNWYVYRVIGAEPERAAETIQVVREKVVADLRTKKAAELARNAAEWMTNQAKSAGSLKSAWEQVEDPASTFGIGVEYAEPRAFARREFSFGQAGLTVAAYLANIGMVSEQFTMSCFDLENAPDKIGVLDVPNAGKIVAAQWLETIPMTKSDYLAQRSRYQEEIAGNRSQLISDWMNSENIRARNGVEYARN